MPRFAPLRRPWVRELAAHVAAALSTLLILVAGLGLVAVRPAAAPVGAGAVVLGTLAGGWRVEAADLRVPFHDADDALLILPLVKATVETGTHWRNSRLGAPGVQELYDFPVIDTLHFAVIRLLGEFLPDAVVVFNVFHLLTYPLTTLTGMAVLRLFGLSVPAAAAGGVLYAFQPYHQLRGEWHYFLSAYYVVPLTLLLALDVCRGRVSFQTRRVLAAVAIAGLTATAGAYYAFFGCLFLCAAGVYGGFAARSWRPAGAAGGVVALVVAGGFAQHLPTFRHHAEYGSNTGPTRRLAEEAEMYGLRLSALVLPIPFHNPVAAGGRLLLDPAGVRSRYDSASRPLHLFAEPGFASLGAVGAAGFVALLAAAVLPVGRAWPVGPLAALTVVGTLFGATSGFGDVFNLLVTPQVRCHNRISIYLAFLAVMFSCWALDRLSDGRPRLRWPLFLGLVLIGVWDQTDDQWFPAVRPAGPDAVTIDEVRDAVAGRYRADREFFGAVEQLFPDGMVFCFPVVPYPEAEPVREPGSPGRTPGYEMVRGYLHTQRLRWSFGAMSGREWDGWQREVGRLGADDLVRRVALAGFGGLLVDWRGLGPAHADRLTADLDRLLGADSPRVPCPARGLTFYDLRDYTQGLEQRRGPAGFAAGCRAERERLSWLWLRGFRSYEPVGDEGRQRWCGSAGEVVVVNPSGHPRTARVRLRLHTPFVPDSPLRVEGGAVWTESIPVGRAGVAVDRTLVVPPGRHRIGFECRPPPLYRFPDSRELVFGVQDFSLTEVPPEAPR